MAIKTDYRGLIKTQNVVLLRNGTKGVIISKKIIDYNTGDYIVSNLNNYNEYLESPSNMEFDIVKMFDINGNVLFDVNEVESYCIDIKTKFPSEDTLTKKEVLDKIIKILLSHDESLYEIYISKEK